VAGDGAPKSFTYRQPADAGPRYFRVGVHQE
jgi:hypothetical protein